MVIEHNRPRWYGATTCEGQHVAIHGRSKIETARDGFAACLQAADDGCDRIVVARHWHVTTLTTLTRPEGPVSQRHEGLSRLLHLLTTLTRPEGPVSPVSCRSSTIAVTFL
jgi:hypothetical protein